MILHLIRHPKPLIEPGICYGQHDVAAENPEPLAQRLRHQLPLGVPVWSSPLQRCRTLAEALHPAPRFDSRLMEMNFGRWEGRPWDAVARHELDAWSADLLHFVPPGGESAAQVEARVCDFLRDQCAEEMVLVTHAGVIRMLLARHENQWLGDFLDYPVDYGEMISIYSFCHI